MQTLGKFYKEKVLCLKRKERILKEFPDRRGDSKIVKDLFGWKLYYGKDFIECRSGEEARFLEVYFDVGMNEVFVPADLEYLKSIVDRLEDLKRKMDEIISLYLDGVVSHKIKERVKHAVYREILTF